MKELIPAALKGMPFRRRGVNVMIVRIRQAGAEILFSILAAGGMAVAFFHWYGQWPPEQTIDTVCAAASALLFLAVLIRMLPGWVKALKNPEEIGSKEETDKPEYAHLKVLGIFLLSLIVHTALVSASRLISGYDYRFWDTFRLYVGLDSNSYYSIAREGYAHLSDAGEMLNLVFFFRVIPC